jgi:hypothetical protein
MLVAGRQNWKAIVGHNKNIGKPKKAKRPIAKPKIAAGAVIAITNQKTWMMHLQYPGGHGL